MEKNVTKLKNRKRTRGTKFRNRKRTPVHDVEKIGNRKHEIGNRKCVPMRDVD